MLTDFIHRYEGVFSKEECQEVIDYIKFLENDGCMFYDREALHLEDHITKNITNSSKYDLDLDSSHRIAAAVIPKFAPCIDDYLKTYSLLGKCQFLLYDCKLKKIPPGGGFHHWHYESASYTSTAVSYTHLTLPTICSV